MEIFFFSHHKGSAPLNGGRLSGRSAEGGQPSARVRGVPENPFSSFLLAACGGEREKRGSWGHPRPRQGEPCTPSGHPPVKGGLPKIERQKENGSMSKLPRLLAMPALVLVLSLSIFSMSAFARSVSLNAVHGALPSVTAQPADSMQAHDGPPPVGYGGGSGGSGGYGGYSRVG